MRARTEPWRLHAQNAVQTPDPIMARIMRDMHKIHGKPKPNLMRFQKPKLLTVTLTYPGTPAQTLQGQSKRTRELLPRKAKTPVTGNDLNNMREDLIRRAKKHFKKRTPQKTPSLKKMTEYFKPLPKNAPATLISPIPETPIPIPIPKPLIQQDPVILALASLNAITLM